MRGMLWVAETYDATVGMRDLGEMKSAVVSELSTLKEGFRKASYMHGINGPGALASSASRVHEGPLRWSPTAFSKRNAEAADSNNSGTLVSLCFADLQQRRSAGGEAGRTTGVEYYV